MVPGQLELLVGRGNSPGDLLLEALASAFRPVQSDELLGVLVGGDLLPVRALASCQEVGLGTLVPVFVFRELGQRRRGDRQARQCQKDSLHSSSTFIEGGFYRRGARRETPGSRK